MNQVTVLLQTALFVVFVSSIFTTFKRHDKKEPVALTILKITFFLFGSTNLYIALQGEPGGYPWLTIVLLIASCALYFWTFGYTKNYKLSLAFSSDAPTLLYTGGPFAIVRNPFYVSYLLWGATFLFSQPSYFAVATFVTLCAAYFAAAKFEEQKLEKKFGPTYRFYKSCVCGFVPNLSSIARAAAGIRFDDQIKRSELRAWSSRGFTFLLIFDWICIIGAMLLILNSEFWVLKVVGVFLIGVLQHALAILSHEATHGFASRSKKINDFIGNVFCLYPLGATLEGYREFHLKHHRYAGTASDPELFVRVNVPGNKMLFWVGLALDFCGKASFDTLKKVKAILPSKTIDLYRLLAFWSGVTGVFAFTGNLEVLFYWFLSVYTVFSGLLKFREYTEHIGTNSTHVFEASRIFKVIFFPHETWCHKEHHDNANIPCYSLPVARAFFKPDTVSLPKVLEQVLKHDDLAVNMSVV